MGKKRSTSTKVAEQRSKSGKPATGRSSSKSGQKQVVEKKHAVEKKHVVEKKQAVEKKQVVAATTQVGIKRKHVDVPAKKTAGPARGRPAKKEVTPPVKTKRSESAPVKSEVQKKRKVNEKVDVIIVEDSDESAPVTPLKKNKKQEKITQKANEKIAKANQKISKTKGKATPAPATKHTPKETAPKTPVKARHSHAVVKVAFPEDVVQALTQTIRDNRTSKLTAEKIIELMKERYLNVNEVAVLTSIGKLFRQGLLTETKTHFAIDDDIIAQLNPAPHVVEPEVEEVPEPVVAAVEEEEVVQVDQTVHTENPENVAETEDHAVTVEHEVHETPAKQSVAKSASKTSIRKASAHKEEAATSVKRSAAKESIKKSANKAEVTELQPVQQLSQEEFADNVMNSEEADIIVQE